jgi:4-amino-4-deoxy-L-arabinose transferase-like glycosyltransferase
MSVSRESSETDKVYLPERSLQEWGIAALLLLLSTLYLWPFRVFTQLTPDEGIALQGAQRLLKGEVLYRDFFSFLTPGSYYWLALRFKIFGDSFFVARAALLLYGGVFSAVTYLLARRVCPRLAALLTAYLLLVVTLPVRFMVLHNWDSMLLALLALYCAVRLLETPGWGWAFATGTLSSLTFLFEQSKGTGLILGLALGFFLIAFRRAHRPFLSRSCSAAIIAGLAWPVSLTLVYFAWHSSLIPMFNDWFWPLRHYSRANRLPYGFINIPFEAWEELYGGGLLSRLINIFLTSPLFILPVLPFLALGVGVYHTYRLRRENQLGGASSYYVLICATSLGLVLSAVATGRPDSNHFFYVGPPLFLVLGWIVGGRSVPSQLLAKVQPLCVAYVLTAFTAFGLIWMVSGPLNAKTRLETRRGVLALNAPDAVIPYVQNHVAAGDKIFVYPYQPMYYYLTATFSPTRYEYLQLGMHAPEQMKQAIDELASDRTEVVLYAVSFNTETVSEVWPSTPDDVLAKDPVRDFLFAHYRPCRALESFRWRYVYMVRRDLRCPAEISLPGLK